MEIVDSYVPNEWQARYHSSNARHKACAGGLGCISEKTLISTAGGPIPIGDISRATAYESLDHRLGQYRLAQGSHAFPKGKANLYRVVHARGEFESAGFHLVYDADHGYRRVDQLRAGSYLNSAEEAPLLTTLAAYLSALREDGRHLMETLEDLMASCSGDTRRYGLQLLSAVAADPTFFLRQVYALALARECGHHAYGLSALQPEPSHSHQGRHDARLANMDFALPSEELALASVGGALFAKSFERTSPSTRQLSQSHLRSELHRRAHEFFVHRTYRRLFDSLSSTSKTPIISIERLPGEEWYWDLQVEDTHNYVAAGVIHHNSGKTYSACQEYKQLALEYPGSIWVIGRKLLPSLKDSIWRDLQSVLPGEVVRSTNKASLNITLKNGSEFWGRPLYDPEIFKSYQISGFLIEEANEVDKEIYDRLKDRMRQKLPDGSRPRYTSTILLNPVDDEHWIPKLFLEQRPPNHELFQSATDENMDNLPEEYIQELEATYSKEVLQRLRWGQFGKIHKGRPVFNSFSLPIHAKPVQYDATLPLARGWDFGFNHPACVFLQMQRGQIRVLGEVLGKRIYLSNFIDQVMDKQKELFGEDPTKGPPILDFCDPRGADESDKGKTSINIMNDHFIFPVFRRTFIEEGLKAINKCLDTIDQSNKQPNFLIHPRCKTLIEGLLGGYHRVEGGEQPEKDGYYEHLIDAARYAIIFLMLRLKAREMTEAQGQINVHIDPRTGRRLEYR